MEVTNHMQVVSVDKEIIEWLRKSGISSEMKSIELCDWLVIQEMNGTILGAAGIGSLLNTTSLQIGKNFRSKGIGPKIFVEFVNEAKKRKYSFLLGSTEASNIASSRIHEFVDMHVVFRIPYSKDRILDIRFLPFNVKGKIIEKIFRLFNSRFGMLILACILRISKPLFPRFLGHITEDIPNPSVTWIMKNFNKV